ncbi:MAG: tRNA (adenosine(37)-N6)-dimethylallyltransferase MiaA [Anaerolineales bacterium]
MNPENKVVAIFGPTAVGKTEAAILAAEKVDAEIVSVDSRQIYRGMDIGTAKPTAEQRARIPHHLIDVADPEHPWSLVDFNRAALAAIDAIHAHRRLPLLVGGTGQYFAAILEGWQPPLNESDLELRRELEAYAAEHGSRALHEKLRKIDPLSAQRIDHRNVRRVVRAIEICHISGRPASSLRRKEPPPFDVLRIGLTMPRKKLYARIDERIEAMIAQGFVQEVEKLFAKGLRPENSAMSAIGYRQIGEYLQGKTTLEQAVLQIRRLTRQFVRRQANWFKADDPQIHWIDAGPDAGAEIVTLIKRWCTEDD